MVEVDRPMKAPSLHIQGENCLLSSHSCHLSKIIFSEPNSFMHMFNVSTLYRKRIKLFHQKLWWELIGPCMAYNSISIKPYTKSHLELQMEITLIEFSPSPYFFCICFAYMNMFARFDENPAMTLQDIKETKRYGRTHRRTT